MGQPPPTLPGNQRRHPRVDLFAQVQVSKDSEVYIMSTANISRGGVFIQGDPADYPDLSQGTTVDLCIFAGEDVGVPEARIRARVVHVAEATKPAPGFGLEFVPPFQPEQRRLLDQLLTAAGSQV